MQLALLPLFSLLLGLESPTPLQPSGLGATALQVNWQSPWVVGFAPDPAIEAILAQYLAGLQRQGWSITDQGIWIQAGHSAIAQHQGRIPMSAASLTKLATTLAALKTWPIDHRFDTLVGIDGTLENGVLSGDLVVQGSGDPLFVWEEGIVLANRLQELGIQRVTGDIRVTGPFTMNFQENPNDSVMALKQVMAATTWPGAARQAHSTLPAGTPQPQIQIDGTVRRVPPGSTPDPVWLVRHQSLPLVGILKAMNIYSNNVMSEMVADLVGGPRVVIDTVTTAANLPPGEMNVINGSGLGTANQMSARVAVALTVALQQELSPHGFSVADVLPVAGEDTGTLIDRRLPQTAAVKTGTLSEVSALSGMIPTADRGPVWFAIINRGWDLSGLRVQQDQLLQAIQAQWGVAEAPPEMRTKVRMQQGAFRYGDPDRNVVLEPSS